MNVSKTTVRKTLLWILFGITFLPYIYAAYLFIHYYNTGIDFFFLKYTGVETIGLTFYVIFMNMFVIPIIPISFHIQLSVLVRKLWCKKIPLKRFVIISASILVFLLCCFYLFVYLFLF